MEQKTTDQINLATLMIRLKIALFRLWPIVVSLSILFGLIWFARARNSYVPMYESKAIFTVDSGYTAEDIFVTGAYYDQYAAQQLAGAFPHFLSLDMMNDLVVQQLDKGYINGRASAEAIADSNMLVLTVQSNNAQDAYDYLCAIIDCFPQVAVYMVDNPQVKIMTAPNLPTEPYTEVPGITTFARGAIIGMALGAVILFIYALMRHTIQTPDELKSTVNLPILIALPKVTQKKRRSGTSLLITADSDPNMAESLRGLRMKVKKLLAPTGGKTILVTSTLAGEGKTTVAINLAYSLISDGHKVLLLDADMRSQSVARTLGEKAIGSGLLDCLKDPKLSITSCIRTAQHGLDYISGRSTEKRHYAIDVNTVRKLLDTLTQQYDYVVIDTPPSEIVSDSAALCRCADCVLYVIRQNYTQKGQILNSITSLHQKDVKIAGIVFNGVPQFHRQYGYGYRSTYGYGYDYGYHKYNYSRYGFTYGYDKNGKYGKYSKYRMKTEEESK
ncbi:MAG: AAA family ATPase [Oscillospiraceae bacterium]|nr:AAA family ATPase [Oscillospiraceae bacterium]